jgi:hypothetical protein
VARDLNNLAELYRATNRLGEAEPLYKRALAIFEQSFGPEHPNTKIVAENLATCRAQLDRTTAGLSGAGWPTSLSATSAKSF